MAESTADARKEPLRLQYSYLWAIALFCFRNRVLRESMNRKKTACGPRNGLLPHPGRLFTSVSLFDQSPAHIGVLYADLLGRRLLVVNNDVAVRMAQRTCRRSR